MERAGRWRWWLVMALSGLRSSVEFLLSLWCLVLKTCLAQDGCNLTEIRQVCGHLKYDINRYTCCNGSITQGPHLACCGTFGYNTMEKSCCNNNITDDLSQTVSKCCGSTAYNPLNQICCGGDIKDRNTSQTLCCGSVLFDPKKKLCCGTSRTLLDRETDNDQCCGKTVYDNLKQCCSDDLEVMELSACQKNSKPGGTPSSPELKQKALSKILPEPYPTTAIKKNQHDVDKKKTSEDSASSATCSESSKHHTDPVTQCCGSKLHKLSEETELCCDGQLYRNQSADSTCFGKTAYSPQTNTLCQQEGHLPPGQHCCGKEPFNPETHICCHGHRHAKTEPDQVCCGSHVYRPKSGKHKCCAGHLHDLTCLNETEDVGCCGTLLMTSKTKQQCCLSADKTLIYKALPEHSCCGHRYYKHSVWSCCAGRLISNSTSQVGGQAVSHRLWLGDFDASDVCNKTVLLGTVESVAIQQRERVVMLTYVLEVNTTTRAINVTAHAQKTVRLNHCQFPVLKTGGTYLWKKVNGTTPEPMADVSSLVSPVHTILSLCQSAT